MNAWLLLGLAIASELIGSTALRYSDGFRRPLPTAITLACYALAFWLLSQSLATLSLGVAYAVWAGVGVAATAIISAVLFKEALTPARLAGMALVVAGVVLLNAGPTGAGGRP